MKILNPRVALKVQLTLVRQKIQFFKRGIERKFPLPSRERVRVRGLWLLLLLTTPNLVAASPLGSQRAIPAATKQKLAKVQIPFIANQGQFDKGIKFSARTFAGTVSVTESGELVYSLPKLEDKKRVTAVTLKEELIGGKVTEIKGESQAVTKLNYFRGNDKSKWQTNVPSYDIVNLGEVYEGIEFKLRAYGNNVEKLLYVKPGAEPETIKIKLSGGKELRVNERGELEVETEQGTVRFSRPVASQEDGTKKEFVEVAYTVNGDEYGFKVAGYDPAKELVIDPILAATFLGSSDIFSINALALDSTGNVYVAGSILSVDIPGAGNFQAFLAKLNSDLSSFLATALLGGSGEQAAFTLALDSTGNVYVGGFTDSHDIPGIGPGSADSTFTGLMEGFVAKLNSDLSSILAATLVGGSEDPDLESLADVPVALVLDGTGNVYVAGVTTSCDFPGVGPGSADNTIECSEEFYSEGFVAKLNSDLSSILAATFLGGSDQDAANDLAFDSTGNVYVVGFTSSPDFPGIGPGFGGFVAKLNSDLSAIVAGTRLTGGGSIVLDSTGNVYVGTGGGVVKLNSDLSSILATISLPLSGALALDSMGNVYVAGTTRSADFPGIGPGSADSTFDGGQEGFVVKLNSDLSSILAATFLGGSDFDRSSGLAIDSTGNVYVAGMTGSADFPGIGPGSADNTFAAEGNPFGEGFVAKLDPNLSRGEEIVNDKVNFVVQNTSLNPTPVPGGPAGVFTITARLTNTSTENILEPINAIVRTLTNGNKLLSATEGNGGAGSKQAIDAGSDDTLIPKESRTVQFRIGLANRNRFSFFVDVSGTVNGDD